MGSVTFRLKCPCAEPSWTCLTADNKMAIGFQFCNFRKHLGLSPSHVAQFPEFSSSPPGPGCERLHPERRFIKLALIVGVCKPGKDLLDRAINLQVCGKFQHEPPPT